MSTFERRDLLARAARDRLAELTSVSPRQLAGLDAVTAGTMARAILYPDRRSARARRAREELRASSRRRRWPWALVVPLPLILLSLGTIVGGSLRARVLPTPHVPAATATRAPAAALVGAGPAPAARTPALAAPDPIAAAALAAVASHLASGASTGPVEVTRGDQAAYVRVGVNGMAGADACLDYLHQQGSAWVSDGVACGRGTGFGPTAGGTAPVHAPGACARLRAAPVSTAQVVTCVPDGATVTLTGNPVYRDGHTWWPATWDRAAGDIAQEALLAG